jgi:hypothetical protein
MTPFSINFVFVIIYVKGLNIQEMKIIFIDLLRGCLFHILVLIFLPAEEQPS